MYRLRAYMLGAAGFLGLSGLIMLATASRVQSQGPANGLSVKVINDATQPVPTAAKGTTNVAGTVNIGTMPNLAFNGTPDVNAKQSGAWLVGLDPNQNGVHDDTAAGKLDTANGHLAALDGLSFNSGNLKVSPQGTQNVNVVGGNLSTAPAIASFSDGALGTVTHHSDIGGSYFPFRVIYASTVILWAERPLDWSLAMSKDGTTNNLSALAIGVIGGGESKVINFPQPVPLAGTSVFNDDLVSDTRWSITVFGTVR